MVDCATETPTERETPREPETPTQDAGVAGRAGRRTSNTVAPGSLSTVMAPWWAVTIAFAIDRPSPVPPV